MSLLPLPFAKMLAKPDHELLWLDLECLADSQQGEDCERPPGFNHLPMPHAEAVGIHVFLAQLTFRSQASDSMAEGAKESRIAGRKVSGSTHPFRLWP